MNQFPSLIFVNFWLKNYFPNLRIWKDDLYFHPILITFVRQDPPLLDEMISKIGESYINISSEFAEKAIRFVKIFVDINLLFDVALGIYDLELALLVAQQSNKVLSSYQNSKLDNSCLCRIHANTCRLLLN